MDHVLQLFKTAGVLLLFANYIKLQYYKLQYYIRKGFLKSLVFKLRLKTLKSEVHLRSNERSFHSFGAARSQRVGRVLKFGFESRYLLFDLRL